MANIISSNYQSKGFSTRLIILLVMIFAIGGMGSIPFFLAAVYQGGYFFYSIAGVLEGVALACGALAGALYGIKWWRRRKNRTA